MTLGKRLNQRCKMFEEANGDISEKCPRSPENLLYSTSLSASKINSSFSELKPSSCITLTSLRLGLSASSSPTPMSLLSSWSLQTTRMLAGGGEEHEGGIQKARISKEGIEGGKKVRGQEPIANAITPPTTNADANCECQCSNLGLVKTQILLLIAIALAVACARGTLSTLGTSSKNRENHVNIGTSRTAGPCVNTKEGKKETGKRKRGKEGTE